MDYIIFGMGTGASLVLVGWLLRELGPRIRDRAPAEGTVLSGGELVLRMAWSRFCATCGMALLLCGLLILIVTGALTLFSAGDDLGTMLVLGTFALTVVLMLLWSVLFIRQFGTFGIFRPKAPKAAPAVPVADVAVGRAAGETTAPPDPDAPDPDREDVPFERAATARGGFGRFSGFLRSARPEATEIPDAAYEPDDEEKRLDVSDPLVTEVYAELDDSDPGEDAPEDLVIEELGGTPDDREEPAASPEPEDDASEPASGDDVPTDGIDEVAEGAEHLPDDAQATLRQRRLERLARNAGDE